MRGDLTRCITRWDATARPGGEAAPADPGWQVTGNSRPGRGTAHRYREARLFYETK